MAHHWLLLTFSWIGSARLQYINTGGPGAETIMNPLDSSLQYPVPYANYFNQPPTSDNFQTDPIDYLQQEVSRKRRTTDDIDDNILPELMDAENTVYIRNEEVPIAFNYDDNNTDIEKRNFSPWGGKRSDKATFEHMWTWKRAAAIREPSMPKRVRFSPWGGKRSGQMIYKPGSKGSKIIFSSSIPELTRIVSNYSPIGKRYNLAGFQLIPLMDKRHPMKVLALSAQMDERTLREALPFKTFLETLPKNYKPGHPYTDVHLKKDGKRKVKFSAWGGKRSPPIIGPIWTPAPQDQKESTLSTILLIRNSPDKEDKVL